MQAGVGLLDRDVMPILHNHCLGYHQNFALFYQLLDFVHPPYYLPSWEKPLVKPMAPGSIFHHISFQSTILQSFTFRSINKKTQKYFIFCLSISIRPHVCKSPWRDWQPLYRVGCKLFDCLCRYWWFVRCLLLDWYLGSLTEGNTYLYFVASPFPLQGEKPTQAQKAVVSWAR